MTDNDKATKALGYDDAVAYTRYEWDCPACDEVNSTEHDPAGETVECDGCGESVRISETR